MTSTTRISPNAADLSIIAEMTATNCVCCHRELTDSESVERGIGPICSGKYYAVQHTVTEDHLLAAKGLLIKALEDETIPDKVVDGFIRFAESGNVRKASNVLVYYASTVHDDQAKVLAVTPAIRALGYTALADKLESDRTSLRLHFVKPDQWAVFFPQEKKSSRYGRRSGVGGVLQYALKGRKGRGPAGYGNRVAYYVADDKFEKVLVVFGYYYGTKGVWIEDRNSNKFRLDNERRKYDEFLQEVYPARWKQQQEEKARQKAQEQARQARLAAQQAQAAQAAQAQQQTAPAQQAQAGSPDHRIVNTGTVLQVFTPYNRNFVSDIKQSVSKWKERRWNPTNRCWEVAPQHQGLVENLISKHYGVTPEVV